MALVGRSRELDQLAGLLESCFARPSGRVVVIEGPAGVGKTTLGSAIIDRLLQTRPGLAVARGRCVQSFESGEPYLPFVDALHDLSSENTAGLVSRSTVSGMIRELAPYWLQVVPLVGNLLSATFSTAAEVSRFKRGGAPSREALFVQYLELIGRLAKQTPLLLFLDDLHWADHASLGLLAYLARGVAKLPVAIVGTLRSVRVEQDDPALAQTLLELEREGLATRVRLAELDERALEQLLRAEFEGDIATPLLRWMHRTAGGNPLFVTELARLLRVSGGAVESQGEWTITEAAQQTEVPRTAEAVIEKRLQRLDADELNLLQYASVSGDEFDSALLARLLGRDELDILDALEPLERHHALVQCTGDIALPDGDSATAYRFHHALVQTVLYRQVVGKRRVLLHRKAAEVMENLWGASSDRVSGRLARHYHEGHVPASAYRFAGTAAESAAGVFANWEAIEFLEIARKNASDTAALSWVAERLGDVYGRVGHYADAIECYAGARGAVPATTTLRLDRKTVALERKAGLAPAPELAQRVHALVDRATDQPAERCRLLLELTRLPGDAASFDRAGEAVRLAETLDDAILLADALERLAVAQLFIEGGVAAAFPLLERALAIARAVNDPVLLVRYYNIAGVARAKLGLYDDARGYFEEALEECERMGDPNGIGAACTNLGFVMLRLGLYAEAEIQLERARTIHERRDRASVVESLFGLAERARLAGDRSLATARYEQLLGHAREFQHWTSEAIAFAGLGICQLDGGDIVAAQSSAIGAQTALTGHDHWFEDRDIIELFFARLDAMQGAVDAAIERLARAAADVRPRDIFLWAQLELERARWLGTVDADRAAAVLQHVSAETAAVQSPPITSGTSALRASIAA